MKFVLPLVFLLVGCPVAIKAQSCLTQDDLSHLLARVDSSPPLAFDKKLKEQLVKMALRQSELLQQVVQKDQTKKSDKEKLNKTYEDNSAKLCQVLKTNGWPTTPLVEEGGVRATFEILKNAGTFELQRDLLPVIVAAIKKDPVQKREFAGLIDRLSMKAGRKQIFGTQAVSIRGFLGLYPVENEAKLDSLRALYDLEPMG